MLVIPLTVCILKIFLKMFSTPTVGSIPRTQFQGMLSCFHEASRGGSWLSIGFLEILRIILNPDHLYLLWKIAAGFLSRFMHFILNFHVYCLVHFDKNFSWHGALWKIHHWHYLSHNALPSSSLDQRLQAFLC